MIEYSCPKCHRRLESPNEHAGISVDCPYCKAQVRVPGGDIFANLDVDDEPGPRTKSSKRESLPREEPRRQPKRYRDDEPDDIDDDEPKSKPRSSSSKKKKSASPRVILLAGLMIAAVFAGGGVLIWQLLASKKPQTTEPEKVEEPAKEEDIHKRAVKSAVFIVGMIEGKGRDEGRIKVVQGSGSVVDKQRKLILTAYHVVEGATSIRVIFPKYDKTGKLTTAREEYSAQTDGWDAKIWKADPSKDLAILKMDWIPPESRAVPLAAESPNQSEETHTIGGFPQESLGLWVYSKGNVREVQKSKFVLDNDQRVDALVVRATNPVNPGDSGGGLYNNKCELVGVCCAINQRAAGVMVFIDVHEVRALLDKK